MWDSIKEYEDKGQGQIIVLVLADGSRLSYFGRQGIDPDNPQRIMEVVIGNPVDVPSTLLEKIDEIDIDNHAKRPYNALRFPKD